MSQVPFVAVHVNSGIELDGNALMPGATVHPEAQVSVMVCPTVSAPLGSRKMYAVPLPALIVAVVGAVIDRVVLPKRELHGVATEQLAPSVNTVADVRAATKSESWLIACAAVPVSTVHELAAVQPYRFDPEAALVR